MPPAQDREGGEFVGPFTDDISGAATLDKRPQLLAAIAELRRGDVLLVAKRDRLARDPLISAMVEAAAKRKGARVVSAAGEGSDGDDPASVLMRRLIDCFAEYERLVIRARTKSALQAKIRRGRRCGSIRYGFDLASDGKTLVPNPAEQDVLALVADLREQGESLQAIADALNARGVPTKKQCGVWRHTAVNRLVSRTA